MKFWAILTNVVSKNLLRIAAINFRDGRSERSGAIFIFRSGALGDFLFSVGALKLLRSEFPDRRLILLNLISGQSLVRSQVNAYSGCGAPWVEMIKGVFIDLGFELSGNLFHDLKMVKSALSIEKNYDVVLLPTPGESPLRILKKIFLFRAAGYFGKIYGTNTTFINSLFRKQQYQLGLFEHHAIQPYRSALQMTGKTVFSLSSIDSSLPEISKISNSLIENKYSFICSEGQRIVISIGSIRPHKIWPTQKYIEIILWLLEKYRDINIVLTGLKSDMEIAKKIIQQVKSNRIISLVGQIDFSELCVLLRNSQLVFGNDGGALHLAAALNKKVVSIISGIEYKDSVYPWGNRDYQVYGEASCAPCYSMQDCPLGTYVCIRNVTTEAVKEKIVLALS